MTKITSVESCNKTLHFQAGDGPLLDTIKLRRMTICIYSLFVDYRVQLESLPSVYGQLSHTPKSLKRLYIGKMYCGMNLISSLHVVG
jgi:hypothetical protein